MLELELELVLAAALIGGTIEITNSTGKAVLALNL